jgi:hypothetical protein
MSDCFVLFIDGKKRRRKLDNDRDATLKDLYKKRKEN